MKNDKQLRDELDAHISRANDLYDENMTMIQAEFDKKKAYFESFRNSMINSATKKYNLSFTNLQERQVKQKVVEEEKKPRKKRITKEQKQIEEAKKRQSHNTKLSTEESSITPEPKRQAITPKMKNELIPIIMKDTFCYSGTDTELLDKYNNLEPLRQNEIFEEILNKINHPIVEKKEKQKKIYFMKGEELYNKYLSRCLRIDFEIENVEEFQVAIFDLIDSDEFNDFYTEYLTDEEKQNIQFISVEQYNELVNKINPHQVDKIIEKREQEDKEIEEIKIHKRIFSITPESGSESESESGSVTGSESESDTPITPESEEEKTLKRIEEIRKILEEDEKKYGRY